MPKSLTQVLRRVLGDYYLVLALVFLIPLVAVAIAPGMFSLHDPLQPNLESRLQPPSRLHPFGTDDLGRDVFSRAIYGIRISVLSAAGVVAISTLVGGAVGLIAGYFRRWVDEVLMRVADMFIAFPTLIIAMAIVAVFGPSLRNAMIAVAVIWWPQYARLMRGQVLQEMTKDYVMAGRALGLPDHRIMLRHILPNCIGPILVRSSLDLGTALLLTASLSFLGLGAQPPSPELGALVTQGRDFMLTAWWYPTLPGLVLFVCVLTANMIGDVVHDWLDPTLH